MDEKVWKAGQGIYQKNSQEDVKEVLIIT